MIANFAPTIAPEIFALRPDYSAVSVIAEGIDNSTDHLAVARYVANTLSHFRAPSWTAGHLEAWREAFRAFGAKPQRTPASVDALLARVRKDGRLPTINPVVDLYNAISVRYALPIGGENIAAYIGSPRLMRALGHEPFDTVKEGQPMTETVPAGEIVWADDHGVTCRRWNWRQGLRTRIDLDTRHVWFVFERLDPMPPSAALEAAQALVEVLREMAPEASSSLSIIERLG